MTAYPTGEQWEISKGDQRATIVEIGGGLREYDVGEVPVLAGFAPDQACDAGRGQTLVPWPNRIRDGRYAFGGRQFQLPLSDVPGHNASHGLVRWEAWGVQEQTSDSLTVALLLRPSPGWWGVLDCRVTYTLGDDGLSVTPRVRNVGPDAVPFGYGAHPYLAIGDVPVEEVVLSVPARTLVDIGERNLPTGLTSAAGDLDFSTPKVVGDAELDTPYTDVVRDSGGRWVASVATGEATRTVWADGAYDWLQVFTGRARDGRGSPRGIAVEPMTCPADAFNSGTGLIVLEPGQEWSGRWGLELA